MKSSLITLKALGCDKIYSVAKEYLLNLYIKAGRWEDAKCLTEELIKEYGDVVNGNRFLLHIAVKSGNISDLRALLKNARFKDGEFKYIVYIVLSLSDQKLQENCLLDVVKSFENIQKSKLIYKKLMPMNMEIYPP